MYETILIPTDGSDGVERAISHGVDVADRYDATVHALSVIDAANLLELGYTGDRADFEATVEPLEGHAKRAVEDVSEQARERGVEVVGVVRQGEPYESIVEYAEEGDVDLIVMGTHGRRGLSRYFLGSVTERVVRTVDVPVLTVRMATER